MSYGAGGADGTPVTITWSENLDQTQAVPGTAYSIAPNGGSGIAGTAPAVSYPAANQTDRKSVGKGNSLDPRGRTSTKHNSNPMVGDTALATTTPTPTT